MNWCYVHMNICHYMFSSFLFNTRPWTPIAVELLLLAYSHKSTVWWGLACSRCSSSSQRVLDGTEVRALWRPVTFRTKLGKPILHGTGFMGAVSYTVGVYYITACCTVERDLPQIKQPHTYSMQKYRPVHIHLAIKCIKGKHINKVSKLGF